MTSLEDTQRHAPCAPPAQSGSGQEGWVRINQRWLGWTVTLAALGVTLAATLLPRPVVTGEPWRNCVLCGERGVADAVVNLLLFAPLGIGLVLAGVRPRGAILAGALLSALIELAQLSVPGRDPSLGDVIFNAGGVGVGLFLVATVRRLPRLDSRASGRASAAAAAAAAGAIALTGLLLRPSWPLTVYYGQWTPDLAYLEWYRGEVLAARVGEVSVGSRRIDGTPQVRALLDAGSPIVVHGRAGPAPARLAPLFSIYDEHRIEVILVGPDRDDLVYRYRTRSAAVRLDQPDLRFRHALGAVRPGDSLAVTVAADPHSSGYCLEVNHRRRCGLGFTAGRGWSLLYYVEGFSEGAMRLLDLVWMAALFFPAGFLLRRRWEGGVALGVGAAAALGMPTVVGLMPTPPAEVGAALGGVAAGMLGAILARRIVPRR